MENKIEILYAEDNRDSVELTLAVLENKGFHVRVVPDGKAAWEAFQKRKPDILMLDLEMPKKTGIELVGMVREVDLDTPVVLYTGFATPANEVAALNEGVNDFISKTVHPNVLVARLKNIYDRICRSPQQPYVYQLSVSTVYNSVTRELKIDGNVEVLKPLDGRLLALLCAKCNEEAEQDYLLVGLWGEASIGKSSEVKKYVTHVRKALSADERIEIRSVGRGGYCLCSK
ncbi:response regulator transcription factor [Butyricimonas sp.]|uniref:response regulator transcription factor n=1 Tax=Butyricimonas sp. TaxID=1969738 RepID=UPI0025BD5697|nr:response regulator transcription factor [Butyricimonas sp.]